MVSYEQRDLLFCLMSETKTPAPFRFRQSLAGERTQRKENMSVLDVQLTTEYLKKQTTWHIIFPNVLVTLMLKSPQNLNKFIYSRGQIICEILSSYSCFVFDCCVGE